MVQVAYAQAASQPSVHYQGVVGGYNTQPSTALPYGTAPPPILPYGTAPPPAEQISPPSAMTASTNSLHSPEDNR